MKNHGRTAVHEFLGDLVVYRNLVPVDPRLPGLARVREELGLPDGGIPRKTQLRHARVMVHLLHRARTLDAPGARIKRLIYVGDTRLNDGTAFNHLCDASGWHGLAFIGSENGDVAQTEIIEQQGGTLCSANRWAALADFDELCRERGFPIDEETAIVVDLDKTALGARGRNDHVIDQARIQAVRRTVGDVLAGSFDPQGFQAAYDRINRVEFHPFTTDNQDYVAYICLILGSRLYGLEALIEEVSSRRLKSFDQFITAVDGRALELPASLRHIHREVYHLVRQGDPTPFKAFRRNEYLSTAERLGCLDDDARVTDLLAREIVITEEVRHFALKWRGQGALLFGLSDKPDEASLPTDDLAIAGHQAIHQIETHAVGGRDGLQ